jgi:ribosome-associated heat shock protein Hsp15
MLQNLRIDKFLWAVRVYKTRNLATEECKKGHVLVNSIAVKPSRAVHIDDIIQIKMPPILRTYKVLGLLEKRVSATIAKDFVIETTPDEEFLKIQLAKNTFEKHDKGAGRPTKKTRRLIDKLKEEEE